MPDPDLEIRGAVKKKKNLFGPSRPQLGLKIRGGGERQTVDPR